LFILICSYGSHSIPALPQIAIATSGTLAQHAATERDSQHDFDFEIGTWKTHLTGLQHPLTGSTAWINYEGTSVVRKVWNGRANLAELTSIADRSPYHGIADVRSGIFDRLTAGFDKLVVAVDEIFECEGGRVVVLGYYHAT
jgi:hypothetical protein